MSMGLGISLWWKTNHMKHLTEKVNVIAYSLSVAYIRGFQCKKKLHRI